MLDYASLLSVSVGLCFASFSFATEQETRPIVFMNRSPLLDIIYIRTTPGSYFLEMCRLRELWSSLTPRDIASFVAAKVFASGRTSQIKYCCCLLITYTLFKKIKALPALFIANSVRSFFH